ncbi:hypothetical protein [Sphaerisporangium corydalis]|uniref:Uncharacterized protein n=1 Tax=Sphaerisporangium corydalis TaxID=1441875 RepID=A0ABV9EGR9_9ACTN|nr:hypothetical protein [Sphaerisporangium corydalis]
MSAGVAEGVRHGRTDGVSQAEMPMAGIRAGRLELAAALDLVVPALAVGDFLVN